MMSGSTEEELIDVVMIIRGDEDYVSSSLADADA